VVASSSPKHFEAFDDLVMSYLLSLYPEDAKEKGWGKVWQSAMRFAP
jgi:hypothetical protein